MKAESAQLVLVDYQEKLMPALFEGEQVLGRARVLARLAGLFDVPCWGAEQSPQKLGPNDSVIRQLSKRTFVRTHFDICASEEFLQALQPGAAPPSGNARSLPRHLQKARAQGASARREQIVLAGCETHVCLLQSALGLLQEEWDVWVVTDACSSRTERNRDAAFDRLAAAGAELVSTEMVAFEWCESSEDERFKEVLSLIR